MTLARRIRNRLRRRYECVTVTRRDARWDHSEFPHPLVTLDFDSDGELLGVVVVGHDQRVTAE